jgi:hypothetical protein
MAERSRRSNAAVPAKKFTPEHSPTRQNRRPSNKSIPEEPVYSKGRSVIVYEFRRKLHVYMYHL